MQTDCLFSLVMWMHSPLALIQAQGGNTSHKISLGAVALAGSTILGGIAAIYTFLAARRDAAVNRLAERYLQAEKAEDKVQNLGRRLARMTEQIEQEIPKEATRLYLENRLSMLIRSIGEQYTEYEDVVSQLEDTLPMCWSHLFVLQYSKA
jgi:hypothetical protein